MNQYDSKELIFPLHKKDWKRLVSNNKSISLNVLYILQKEVRRAGEEVKRAGENVVRTGKEVRIAGQDF